MYFHLNCLRPKILVPGVLVTLFLRYQCGRVEMCQPRWRRGRECIDVRRLDDKLLACASILYGFGLATDKQAKFAERPLPFIGTCAFPVGSLPPPRLKTQGLTKPWQPWRAVGLKKSKSLLDMECVSGACAELRCGGAFTTGRVPGQPRSLV